MTPPGVTAPKFVEETSSRYPSAVFEEASGGLNGSGAQFAVRLLFVVW